ncbi:MAG: hypothetical protein K2X74_00660 [Acetobacteraceae bacterium]|nr:hypothetical protein [Acetobacteraceae bacterium]
MPDAAPPRDISPAERLWCADLAASARLLLNHLATALQRAEDRGDGATAAIIRDRIAIGIRYERTLAKRGGSAADCDYEPSPLLGDADRVRLS